MLRPPFPPAPGSGAVSLALTRADACCARDDAVPAPGSAIPRRVRLTDLDPHLHCSVIGTCLGTAELRQLMARFVEVAGTSDLDVHHEAVQLAARGGEVAKALHKALDRKHDAALHRFGRVRDEDALLAQWVESLQQGDVPGAYWALLTHRSTTAALRQRMFGDVHMLSHLVGAANRADIRRLVALEDENAQLQERLERQQQRSQNQLEERQRSEARLQELGDALARLQAQVQEQVQEKARLPASNPSGDADRLAGALALQAERRERAGAAAAEAIAEAGALRAEVARLAQRGDEMACELAAAETQLRDRRDAEQDEGAGSPLHGRRILYVGGRPGSTTVIRDIVVRRGGEFQRHDGGLEERKGMLDAAVAWAQLVVFPVDCIDHDSAIRLKRACHRLGTAFRPLRTANVATFAAMIAELEAESAADVAPICRRTG
jgi:Uncharacterized protein conserved in bacteria (DUF2325)